MKYIISKGGIPVVFSELQQHVDVAQALFTTIVGAGFCKINDNKEFVCYGESISLGIQSRLEVDSKIINRSFGLVDPY
jgi:hypothetical protein